MKKTHVLLFATIWGPGSSIVNILQDLLVEVLPPRQNVSLHPRRGSGKSFVGVAHIHFTPNQAMNNLSLKCFLKHCHDKLWWVSQKRFAGKSCCLATPLTNEYHRKVEFQTY